MIFLMSESKLLESVSSEPVTPMTLDVEPVFVEDFFRETTIQYAMQSIAMINKTEITPQIEPITIQSISMDSAAGVDLMGSASLDFTYFGAATLT